MAFETFLDRCPSDSLQFLGPNQLKDRPPVLNKLARYEKEHPSRSTVAVIGSSLAQYSTGMCDFGVYGSPDLNKEFATYSRFRYFDKLLGAAPGEPLETANLSNSGTMLSEDFLIIKEVFSKKNPPKAIVLELGPRDFIDNMTPDPYRSRLAQVLIKHQEPLNWQINRTIAENLDVAAEKLSLFYSMRGELHDCLIKIACDRTHHPASIYQATIMAKLAPPPAVAGAVKVEDSVARGDTAKAGDGKATKKDEGRGALKFGFVDDYPGSEGLKAFSESEYRGRYLPLNEKKWPVEVSNLKNILAFCRDRQIPLVIVNMPLTQRNLKILPAEFLARYENMMTELCTPKPGEKNLAYVNLRNDGRFVTEDYRDTAHMRSTGGKKLADLLAPVVLSVMQRGGSNDGAESKMAAKGSIQ